MYERKKIRKVLTSKSVGIGPSSYEKKNLPGRGLTKVEKHWSRNHVNEEALAHWGLSRRTQTNKHVLQLHCTTSIHPHVKFAVYRAATQILRSRGARIPSDQNFGILVIRSNRLSRRAPPLPFSQFCCTQTLDMFTSLSHSYSLLASHFAMNNLSTPEGHFAPP